MASSAPLPKTAAPAPPLASHNPSIDENEKPISGNLSASSPSSAPPAPFRGPPRPSTSDRVRSYLLSTHFQCAVQLTVGVGFLSLFVLVDEMRFPMSCQAAVIYGTKEERVFFPHRFSTHP